MAAHTLVGCLILVSLFKPSIGKLKQKELNTVHKMTLRKKKNISVSSERVVYGTALGYEKKLGQQKWSVNI